jgi:hypothetical protein
VDGETHRGAAGISPWGSDARIATAADGTSGWDETAGLPVNSVLAT